MSLWNFFAPRPDGRAEPWPDASLERRKANHAKRSEAAVKGEHTKHCNMMDRFWRLIRASGLQ